MSGQTKSPVGHRTGEVIRIPTQQHADAADGVLQFFALLAYPAVSEQGEREKAAEALNAAIYKARIWDHRNDRSVRVQLPLDVRKMRIRSIQQQMNKWMKRINKRLEAGNIAARFYFKDSHILYQERTPSGSKGIWIAGPSSTREALKELVRAREDHGINRERDDATENERKHTWLPSLPVLHLCLELFVMVRKISEPADFEGKFYKLYEHPEWLQDSLLRAEGLRSVLHECIPEFDPDKAVRMLPSDSLPRIRS